jgi:hypothetical protein
MSDYRVQIIDPDGAVADERQIAAGGPDEAAQLATGERLVRGAKGSRNVLRVKVYFQRGGLPTMVRYYGDDSHILKFQ